MKKILIFSMMLALFGSDDALAFDPAEALKKKRAQAAQQAAAQERARIEQPGTLPGFLLRRDAQERARIEQLRGARYGAFQVHNNGTVTIQGKQWMRCSLGQRWSGSTCTGTAVEANWHEAQELVKMMNQAGGFAGFRDWRLPTIAELELLRVCSSGRTQDQKVIPGKGRVFENCDGDFLRPTIDSTLFPNTPEAWFWSSSPYANAANLAWFVSFYGGYVHYDLKSASYRVRLVRAGQ